MEKLLRLHKKHSKPKGDVNWDIGPHPRYEWYPELQQAILGAFRLMSDDICTKLLTKYGVTDANHIGHFTTLETMIKMEADIYVYQETGVLPDEVSTIS